MASVTPGVLLKLLQSMSTNPSAPRVTGDHRSAVVQLTGIVPAASLSPADGFYLQISDSVNSTYVLPPVNAPSADSYRLGQLLHLDRLLPSHPLPIPNLLKPIPSRSAPPAIAGSPEPLLAVSDPSNPNSFIIQHSSALPQSTCLPRPNPQNPPQPKRRFSSPAARTASPAGAKRASSPVPSKCAVPGLVQAKEENRKVVREPAIVVPSRYRQPSPVGTGRRGSVSPAARRVSRAGSPAGSGGGEKRRSGVVVAGISRGLDGLMGGGRSVRKSWDESGNSGGSGDSKEKKSGGSGNGNGNGSRTKVDQQSILRTQVFCL